MKIYEISVWLASQDPVAVDRVRMAFSALGVADFDIVEQHDLKGRRLSVFLSTLPLARRLRSRFLFLGVKGVRVLMRVHDQNDWQTRWKKGWKPFSITPRIHVIPSFIEGVKCPRGKIPLYLDTTAAFGTGLHETTRFSAQLIEMQKGLFKTFLDIGTGTGILVAVALLSGASYAEAFDIDDEAVKVAQDNLKANRLKCDVLRTCDVGKYKVRKMFDLVAANLVTHDLVSFREKIIATVAPGGFLIISGISLRNMTVVKKSYNSGAGLRPLKVIKGKEWSAFLFQRVA